MVVNETVLADTNIFIKGYRGDNIKIANLKKLKDRYSISIITTACELLAGNKNLKPIAEMNKLLRVYSVTAVNEKVSGLAHKVY